MTAENQLYVTLEIEQLPADALEKLFQEKSPTLGFTRNLMDGVSAENRTSGAFGIEPCSVATIVITVAGSIATSIVANAIYDWLKTLVTPPKPQDPEPPEIFIEIYIQGHQVDLSPESIKSAIEDGNESNEHARS